MKLSTFKTVVASTFALAAFAIPAVAGGSAPDPNGVVPEPSAILVWAGIAAAGGVAYWWHKRRQS